MMHLRFSHSFGLAVATIFALGIQSAQAFTVTPTGGATTSGIDNPPVVNGAIVNDPGFAANTLAANDDDSTGLVNIGFSANFFGTTYTQLYVNNNGNVTFNAPLAEFTPFGLTANTGIPIIAPFFGDVDTRGTGSGLTQYGTGTFDGRSAFGVDYINVGYFNQGVDKLNSFQLILVDRSNIGIGDFDIVFKYDKVQWETGNASGGTGGLGGSSARVGYSKGTGVAGTYLELAGSAVNGAFLDGGAEALISNTNVPGGNVPGHYVFNVRGGNVLAPAPVPEPSPLMATMALAASFAGLLSFKRFRNRNIEA